MAENEERFWEMADRAPAMIWAAGRDGLRTHFNKRWLDFTGRPAQSQLDNGWTESVHPDDRGRCLGIFSASFDRRQEFKMEYRLRRHDGEHRWVCDMGIPRFEADGSFAGYIGSCSDINDSRLAADALSRFIRRLIEAQDQERIRIARELHDDIGASLAIVGIELMRAGQPAAVSPGQTPPDVQEIFQKLQEIGSRISRISNQLNPPMLKYFGLAKAIETECQEFSKRHSMPVSCSCNNIPAGLSPVIALNFFRAAEEALHNAGAHSHATSVSVEVSATSTELILVVSDNGVGFDVEQARLAGGLGLIRMRERMRLIGGELEIQSQPGQGAKILCRAPLAQSE